MNLFIHKLYVAPPSGFLGEGDMVTQAIHDAQLLLRSHSSGGGRERDKERERDGGGKMVSGGRISFSFVLCFSITRSLGWKCLRNSNCVIVKTRTGLILRPTPRLKTNFALQSYHSCVHL